MEVTEEEIYYSQFRDLDEVYWEFKNAPKDKLDKAVYYVSKKLKLNRIRQISLESLLKLFFGSKGFSYSYLDCESGGFFDVTIYGNGIYEQFVVHHDSMTEDLNKNFEKVNSALTI